MKEDEITETYGMFYVGVVKADGRERARIVELEARCAALETRCAKLQTDLDKCKDGDAFLVLEMTKLQELKIQMGDTISKLESENRSLSNTLEKLEDTRDGEGSDSG